MNIQSVYRKLKLQRDQAQAGMDALEPFIAQNGHRVMHAAETALEAFKPKRPYRKGKHSPNRAGLANRMKNGQLPTVKAPAGLSLAGVEPADAIRLALKAAKGPLHTPNLTALLLAAGFKPPSDIQVPILRYVGQRVSVLVKNGEAKKTKTGAWALK